MPLTFGFPHFRTPPPAHTCTPNSRSEVGMKESTALSLVVLVAAASSGQVVAHAAVTPDGLSECVGKATGEACDGGSCQEQTCGRRDYENWDGESDGGPAWIEYDCLLCGPGGGASARDSGVEAGGTAAAGGTGGGGGAFADAGPGSGLDNTADTGCGSCATGGRNLGLRGAALSFALFMGLWLGRARPRKSR